EGGVLLAGTPRERLETFEWFFFRTFRPSCESVRVGRRVLLLALAACGAPRPPCSDASTPLDAKEVPLTVAAIGPKFPVHGPAPWIAALPNGQHAVEVAGGGYADQRKIVVATAPGEPLPFRVGQVLDVSVEPNRLLAVRDASGALLAMVFASDAELEDWS